MPWKRTPTAPWTASGTGNVGGDAAFPGCNISPEAVEFGRAIDAERRRRGRHLSPGDILATARACGWRKGDGPDETSLSGVQEAGQYLPGIVPIV